MSTEATVLPRVCATAGSWLNGIGALTVAGFGTLTAGVGLAGCEPVLFELVVFELVLPVSGMTGPFCVGTGVAPVSLGSLPRNSDTGGVSSEMSSLPADPDPKVPVPICGRFAVIGPSAARIPPTDSRTDVRRSNRGRVDVVPVDVVAPAGLEFRPPELSAPWLDGLEEPLSVSVSATATAAELPISSIVDRTLAPIAQRTHALVIAPLSIAARS
ncbi:MAG: hypothetical protein ACSLFA_00475 [Mycobacterium sp.]